MSAVSKRLIPASVQMPMSFLASATSVSPHALKNSVPPPKVAAPKQRLETFKPELPKSRYSMNHWILEAKNSWKLFAKSSVRRIASNAPSLHPDHGVDSHQFGSGKSARRLSVPAGKTACLL